MYFLEGICFGIEISETGVELKVSIVGVAVSSLMDRNDGCFKTSGGGGIILSMSTMRINPSADGLGNEGAFINVRDGRAAMVGQGRSD